MKPKHFYCETYFQNYYFCPGWTAKQVKDYFNIDLYENSHGSCSHNSQGVVIWVKGNGYEALENLCHESIHAANFTLDSKGVDVTTRNDEALAYLAQFVFRNCLKHLKIKK